MKTKKLINLIAIALVLLSNAETFAGANGNTRANCGVLKKYTANARVFNYGVQLGWQYSASCSYAYAYKSASHCYAQCTNSSAGCYPVTWSDRWWASGGNAFAPPATAPTDSNGIARCELSSQASVSNGPVPNTTVVELSNFSGSMVAATNTSYGSVYRIIIWKGTTANDSELTSSSQALYDGSVRIEHGQVIADGIFNPSDFNYSMTIDSLGAQVIKVEPIPNLSKTITLNVNNSDNSVAVSVYGDAGFGNYDPIFPYVINPIPTLSQWGLIIFTLLMLSVTMVFVYKRQNALAVAGNAYSQESPSLFDRSLFFKVLSIVLLFAAAGMAAAKLYYGTISITDSLGTFASAGIVAYMVHLWKMKRE